MSINNPYTLTISLLTITALSGAVLSSTVFADSNTAQDNVSVNVPVSCTMNGTGMTSHTANIPNGTYEANIGTTTLKSFCNDSQGFAIYAIGYTNEEYGNTTLIGANQGQTIVTGTATTTGNPDVSNWAIKLETSSGATYPLTLDNGFGSYSSVPSSYTKVAHRDSGTDLGSSATGASLTTTYAAYISKGQKADTYDGKVKFTLVHPSNEVPAQPIACEAGKICFNPNTATALGEMGKKTLANYEITYGAALWAPNFKRDGYGFAGWNTEYDYSGTTYGPNENITVPANISTDGLSLYAVWVKSAGTLQNWSGCSNMSIGDITALTDNRDNDTYAVAKLADNKCWMIENLRLDNTPELSATNTHNPSLPLTNSWWYSSANDSDTKPTSNHLSPATDPTQTAWCTASNSACVDQSMLATNNTTLFTNNTAANYSVSSNVYSYGNYYNWYSAAGGFDDYDGISIVTGYDATGDICPAGWHLPTGKATGDFATLDIALGGTGEYSDSSTTPTGATMSQAYRSYPNNFVFSGNIPSSSINERNSLAGYWSASGFTSSGACLLYLNRSQVEPGRGSYSKSYGEMVRCVAGI